MTNVEEARKIIWNNTPLGSSFTKMISECHFQVISEEIASPIPFPETRQSAMDGYAIRYQDYLSGKELTIIREIQAGSDPSDILLPPYSAVRIFTGAIVPHQADTVVVQEKTHLVDHLLYIDDTHLIKGANIRPIGSQCRLGDTLAKPGDVLTPGMAGLLCSVGIDKVPVYSKPRIAIINTGKELATPGLSKKSFEIYESNSISLKLALQHYGFDVVYQSCAEDEQPEIISKALEALPIADVVLFTGGVSVGKYDLVIPALQQLGFEQLFHKIKQKPGKPLYFGRKENQLVFGLPGNPGSVLTCFYIYVLPCLRKMAGYSKPELFSTLLPLSKAYHKNNHITHFAKAILNQQQELEILDHQESYKMNSFAKATCLIEFDENETHFHEGQLVKTYIIAN